MCNLLGLSSCENHDSINHRVVVYCGSSEHFLILVFTACGVSCWAFPCWYEGMERVSPTDVHILSYHSNVSVVPEWRHIARAVTIDLSNEHLIRFI